MDTDEDDIGTYYDWQIPIERHERGLSGLIRDNGVALIAHRPEAHRFFRLARIMGAARAMAAGELGPERAAALFSGALVSLADYKGDFFARWRGAAEMQTFRPFIDRALALEGEEESEHAVAGQVLPEADA